MKKKPKIVLLRGDCLVRMKDIADKSIDCIITDPPYNIGYADWDNFKNVNKIAKEWERVLAPNGSIFVFCGWSFVTTVIRALNKKFILNDWIIYDRIKGRGAKKRLVSTREDLLWYVNSDRWTFNKDLAYSTIVKKTKGMGTKNGKATRALSNVWTDISPIVPWSKERVQHPTQKPVQIIERILTVFTNKGDTVLDSYMGSGTTGVACKKLGRNFMGIESNKTYFKLAKNRIINLERLR